MGWSSPVSRTISFRESDSQRTHLFKDSGMDERFNSFESYQLELTQDCRNKIIINL